jgi:hypothetical protein
MTKILSIRSFSLLTDTEVESDSDTIEVSDLRSYIEPSMTH